LNLKGFFSESQLLSKVFLLLAILFISFLLHQMLALFLVSLIIENGYDLFFSYDLTSKKSINILKTTHFFSAIGTFISPIVIYGYLTNFSFGFTRKISRQSILLVIALMILIIPLISFILDWNMKIEFPDWLSNFNADSEPILIAFLNMSNPVDLIVNLIIMAIIPAIGEELFFRGFLQKSLISITKNQHIAVLITSFLFSAIHFHLDGFIPRFMLGILLGYMFLWSGSLWIPILAHFTNNAIAVIISYPSFQSFEIIQNFNHYNEYKPAETTSDYLFFSALSVSVILYLLYNTLENERLRK
jgi:membrane protease YdiL (CAAX protease family)